MFHLKNEKKEIIHVVHNVGYMFNFEIEKEKSAMQPSEIYKNKLKRLECLQVQIVKLQAEQERLLLEIKQFEDEQQLGNIHGRKK